VRSYEQAILLWEATDDHDIPTGIRLYSKIGEIWRWGAMHPNAAEYIMAGLDLLGDEPTLEHAHLYCGLAFTKFWNIAAADADYEGAQAAAETALEIATQFDDPAAISAALAAMGGLLWVQDRGHEAWSYTQRRRKLYDLVDDREQLDIDHMVSSQLGWKGEYAEAAQMCRDFIALGKERGIVSWQLGKRWDLIAITIAWGRWSEALQTIEDYIQLSEEVGGRYWSSGLAVPAFTRMGIALCELLGEEERILALKEASQGVQVSEEDLRNYPKGVHEGALLSGLLLALNKTEEAAILLSDLEDYGRYPVVDTSRIVMNAVLAAQSGHPDAVAIAKEAVTRTEGHFIQQATALSEMALGLALMNENQMDEAHTWLEQALDNFTSLDSRWGRGATLLALAAVVAGRGDAETAATYREQAIAIFEKIGAHGHASRVRQSLGQAG